MTSGTETAKTFLAVDAATTSGATIKVGVGQTVRRMRDITAAIVADRIINFCHNHGDLITNLKLQRLLYYAQAWYLALHEKKLFQVKIQLLKRITVR